MAVASTLIAFYRGETADSVGRSFDEILAWDDLRLEMVHDYIQWIFPNAEPSRFNPDAPLLSEADIATFRTDAHLRARVALALDRMLRFYGLRRAGAAIVRDRADRLAAWLTPLNHNHLRLTRILLCLRACGLEAEAHALLTCLEGIVDEDLAGAVSPRTREFWRGALNRG